MFDGTFEYCPKEFYDASFEVNGETYTTSGQTYTMHAVYSNLPGQQSSFVCGMFLKFCLHLIVF
jgi:hypothetical protein